MMQRTRQELWERCYWVIVGRNSPLRSWGLHIILVIQHKWLFVIMLKPPISR